jgi:hypothetical protein
VSDLRKASAPTTTSSLPAYYREEQRYKVLRGNAIPMLDLDRV